MNTSNVTTGKPKITGAVFRAPVGTELATDTTTELNVAFKELGYSSDAGIVNSDKREAENIKAWGGDTVLTPTKSKSDSFKFTLLESTNEEVLKAVYGSKNVSGTLTTGITVKVNAADAETAAWTFDMILRDGAAKRITIPKGTITEVGEIKYTDADAIAYEITMNCEPDEYGQTHYEYIKKGA